MKEDPRSREHGAREGSVGKKRTKPKAPHGGRRANRYPYVFRLRAVQLHEEESYPVRLIATELGCNPNSIRRWLGRYRLYGQEGLREGYPEKAPTEDQPSAVKAQITALKRRHPSYGVRRISDVLRRFFWIKASPSTVHQTLKKEGLIEAQKRKAPKNPGKPRFFERSTPNQLWQSDIMSFRLGGKAVYLIGFIDDYSRYLVALGLYRSQTAENVLESYRQAVGDYGCPKEMLTDNGRQYATWRGRTRFQRELERDRIHHLRSQPHHPMTLGKIERFWKTILEEFLNRAKFGSFEEARERIALWVKYYNHKRPHQGIGGLCPADRYFEINHTLKETLQSGVQDNILETALRGRPQEPFYMVGRMGAQHVVIRADKGKVRMLVDGAEAETPSQELTYPTLQPESDHEQIPGVPKQVPSELRNETAQTPVHRRGEDPGGPGDLDRTAPTGGPVPGAGDHAHAAGLLAKEGDAGPAQGAGAAAAGGGTLGPAHAPGEDPLRADAPRTAHETCPPDGAVAHWPAEDCAAAGTGAGSGTGGSGGGNGAVGLTPEPSPDEPDPREERPTSRSHPPGPMWPAQRERGGEETGSLPQDLLRMGAQGPLGPHGRPSGWDRGSAGQALRPDPRGPAPGESPAAAPEPDPRAETGHPHHDGLVRPVRGIDSLPAPTH